MVRAALGTRYLKSDASCAQGLASSSTAPLAGVRVAVASYGVLCRSWSIAWPTVEQRVLRVLREHGARVDPLLFFSLELPQGSRIDSCPACVTPTLPAGAIVQARSQPSLDDEISFKCNQKLCSFSHEWYDRSINLNALRQMYSETRVAGMLRAAPALSADVAVVVGPDLYLPLDINVSDVLKVQ